MPEPKDLEDGLLDPQDASADNVLLDGGHLPLQPPDLLLGGLVDGPLRGEGEEARDRLGVDGGEAVDDAAGVEGDDGAELLAEAGVDAELGVVDLGVERDLKMVRDVAMGPISLLVRDHQ